MSIKEVIKERVERFMGGEELPPFEGFKPQDPAQTTGESVIEPMVVDEGLTATTGVTLPEPTQTVDAPPQEGETPLTPSQIQQVMQSMSTTFMDGIREMKKPDEATAEKFRKQKEREERAAKSMRAAAMLEMENKKKVQDNCPHLKENNKSTLVGQVHSDGLIHPICQRCQKEFKPYAPEAQDVAGGII